MCRFYTASVWPLVLLYRAIPLHMWKVHVVNYMFNVMCMCAMHMYFHVYQVQGRLSNTFMYMYIYVSTLSRETQEDKCTQLT